MSFNLEITPFKIIGVSVRTTNENGQSMKDLAGLWQKFYSLNVFSRLNNKESDDFYAVYTDYNPGNHSEYTAIVGCKVHSFDNVPEGLTKAEVSGGKYIKVSAHGKMPQALQAEWQKIWADKKIRRKYSSDFELYDENSLDPDNAEIDIYISVEE